MFTFLAITTGVVFLLLILTASVRPEFSHVSAAELARRAKAGDTQARRQLKRERLLPDVVSLLRSLRALLLVATALLSVVTFGWLSGTLLAILVTLLYGAIARLDLLVRHTNRLYERWEPSLLRFVTTIRPVFRFIRSEPQANADEYHRFDSREELQELIARSGDVLLEDEKKLVAHALGFGGQRVDSVMTPRSEIKSIKKSEFLGPLVLDELHGLGRSRLPVIASDLDHVVGTLYLRDLLSLDIKRSVTAEKAMEPRVYYIRRDQTLEHALGAFLRTHHHLFIVINEARETVGLLTLEDVIEAMTGRKIIDEDDHENIKAAATGSTEAEVV